MFAHTDPETCIEIVSSLFEKIGLQEFIFFYKTYYVTPH